MRDPRAMKEPRARRCLVSHRAIAISIQTEQGVKMPVKRRLRRVVRRALGLRQVETAPLRAAVVPKKAPQQRGMVARARPRQHRGTRMLLARKRKGILLRAVEVRSRHPTTMMSMQEMQAHAPHLTSYCALPPDALTT